MARGGRRQGLLFARTGRCGRGHRISLLIVHRVGGASARQRHRNAPASKSGASSGVRRRWSALFLVTLPLVLAQGGAAGAAADLAGVLARRFRRTRLPDRARPPASAPPRRWPRRSLAVAVGSRRLRHDRRASGTLPVRGPPPCVGLGGCDEVDSRRSRSTRTSSPIPVTRGSTAPASRVAAERDVFLEDVKDSAIAIYSRDVAIRYLGTHAARRRFRPDHGRTRARELAARYDLDYLVARTDLPLPVAYRNERFRVYALDRRGRTAEFELLRCRYSSSVSIRCACTIPSHGDQANTVNRPSCEATSASASRWS